MALQEKGECASHPGKTPLHTSIMAGSLALSCHSGPAAKGIGVLSQGEASCVITFVLLVRGSLIPLNCLHEFVESTVLLIWIYKHRPAPGFRGWKPEGVVLTWSFCAKPEERVVVVQVPTASFNFGLTIPKVAMGRCNSLAIHKDVAQARNTNWTLEPGTSTRSLSKINMCACGAGSYVKRNARPKSANTEAQLFRNNVRRGLLWSTLHQWFRLKDWGAWRCLKAFRGSWRVVEVQGLVPAVKGNALWWTSIAQ